MGILSKKEVIKRLGALYLDGFDKLNPMNEYRQYKKMSNEFDMLRNRFYELGWTQEYYDLEVKKEKRKQAFKLTSAYILCFIPILFMILTLVPLFAMIALTRQSLLIGDLGDTFPFSRTETRSWELYNKEGRLFSKSHKYGEHRGFPVVGRCNAKIDNLGSGWCEVDLRSEASKIETDEMLIQEYLLYDPIPHVLIEEVKIDVYFLGIHIVSEDTSTSMLTQDVDPKTIKGSFDEDDDE